MIARVKSAFDRLPVGSDWIVWSISAATLASGLVNVFHTLNLRFHGRHWVVESGLPYSVHSWGRTVSILLGLFLVFVSLQLLRRRRLAWWLAVTASVAAALSQIGRPGSTLLALIPAANVAGLIALRRHFVVKVVPSNLAQGIAGLMVGVLFAIVYGSAGFWLLDRRDFGTDYSLPGSITQAIKAFVWVGYGELVPRSRHAAWFLESLKVIGAASAVFAAYSLFRPLRYALRMRPRDAADAHQIVEAYGRASLDFFKTLPDKSLFFDQRREGFVAYRVSLSVAVVLGDPVGPAELRPLLVTRFAGLCEEAGWLPTFHQAGPDMLDAYRAAGFRYIKVGEEAMVDLAHYASAVSATKEFRRPRERFTREGYRLTMHRPPHDHVLMTEIASVSREWLSIPGRRERGFTMGRFERSYVENCALYVLRDAAGRVGAFVNLIPCYPAGDATIDLMRHRSELPNGAMDYLFDGLFRQLLEDGHRRFSLGLAPLSGVGDRPGATFEERAAHEIFERLNRFFSYKGMRHYKAKFDPAWEPRFLAYRGGPPGLVRAALALTRLTEG